MTDREKSIVRNIDRLTEDCISYLESNYSTIPNIGLFNMDLIVFAFLMERLLEERDFKGQSMQKFLTFYEKHFISNRCNSPRKTTVYNLGNDEIDSKNLVAYFKFEEMDNSQKRQYFIRTLSNISPDLNKFMESIRNYNGSSKIHYPFLALINVYVDPLFCYKIPIDDYNQEIRYLSYEIKNSDLDLNKFLHTFSKMWIEVVSKFFDDGFMFLDSIELNFE